MEKLSTYPSASNNKLPEKYNALPMFCVSFKGIVSHDFFFKIDLNVRGQCNLGHAMFFFGGGGYFSPEYIVETICLCLSVVVLRRVRCNLNRRCHFVMATFFTPCPKGMVSFLIHRGCQRRPPYSVAVQVFIRSPGTDDAE